MLTGYEAVKNFRKRNREGRAVNAFDYLDAIADLLIDNKEIEEKKLREKARNIRYAPGMTRNCYCTEVDPFVPSDSGSVGVEVGQIWRTPVFKHYMIILEIDKEDGSGRNIKFRDETGVYLESLEWIKRRFELVTMDNIKPNEWVESIGIITTLFGTYTSGFKFKVTGAMKGKTSIEVKMDWGMYTCQKESFKPCLPPIEEKEKSFVKVTEFTRTISVEEAVANAENYFKFGMRTSDTSANEIDTIISRVLEGSEARHIEGTKATKVIISEDIYKMMKRDYIKIFGTPKEALTLCNLKILIANDPNGELVDFVEVL